MISRRTRPGTLLAVTTAIAGALVCAGPAQAQVYGGVFFPGGASSFADAVASFDPIIKNGQPTAPYLNSAEALGVPDDASVSLGDGGSITLTFTNNSLTGSGSSALDLWIFEIGADVEDTFVEISKDGSAWFSVGKVSGSTAGIDIDAFGFGVNDLFAYVRLTDDSAEGGQTGASVGADIDAVGAISSGVSTVPEPGSMALLAGAVLGGLFMGARRRTLKR
jgi:hypothetical protein